MLEPDGSTRGKADAVELPIAPCLLAPTPQAVVIGDTQQLAERGLIVAGIEHCSSRRPIRKRPAGYEIAPPQLGGIDVEPARGDVHDPLEREVELRAAIAAIEADRRAVRDH